MWNVAHLPCALWTIHGWINYRYAMLIPMCLGYIWTKNKPYSRFLQEVFQRCYESWLTYFSFLKETFATPVTFSSICFLSWVCLEERGRGEAWKVEGVEELSCASHMDAWNLQEKDVNSTKPKLSTSSFLACWWRSFWEYLSREEEPPKPTAATCSSTKGTMARLD